MDRRRSSRSGRRATATRSRASGSRRRDRSVVVAATLPAYPVVTAGAIVEVGGRLRPPPDDDPYGAYLRRTGASGSLDARELRVIETPGLSLQVARDAAGDALRQSLPEPEAGLAAGILIGLRERVDQDARRGLRDGRREPRRRDLGLEHRDRRRARRGGAPGTPPAGRHRRRAGDGHRVRDRGGRVAVGRAGGRHGRRRAARARVGQGRACRGGARGGGRAAAARRSGADRRRGLPPLGARDGRAAGLGEPDRGVARRAGRRADARLARGEPRDLARRAGRDAARRRRDVRAAVARRRRASTWPSCRSCRWRWRRRAGAGRRAATLPRGARGRRRRCSGCPAWLVLHVVVARGPGRRRGAVRRGHDPARGGAPPSRRSRRSALLAAPRPRIRRRAASAASRRQRGHAAPGRRRLAPAADHRHARGPGDARRGRDRRRDLAVRPSATRPDGRPGSRCWTSGRATRSCSRRGPAPGCSSTAARTRSGCSSSWTSGSRHGTGASTSSS